MSDERVSDANAMIILEPLCDKTNYSGVRFLRAWKVILKGTDSTLTRKNEKSR